MIMLHEYIHILKNKRKGKTGFMALKLDMVKAYDRVAWTFIEAITKKIGLCDIWIHGIMECVTTVSHASMSMAKKENTLNQQGIRKD